MLRHSKTGSRLSKTSRRKSTSLKLSRIGSLKLTQKLLQKNGKKNSSLLLTRCLNGHSTMLAQALTLYILHSANSSRFTSEHSTVKKDSSKSMAMFSKLKSSFHSILTLSILKVLLLKSALIRLVASTNRYNQYDSLFRIAV